MEKVEEHYCEYCKESLMHDVWDELETSDGADEIHCSNHMVTVLYKCCISCGEVGTIKLKED